MAKSTLEDMDQQIQIIREYLKRASDRQTIYANKKKLLEVLRKEIKYFSGSNQREVP